MPIPLLSIGPPNSLAQNEVYALPGVSCDLFCDTAATLQVSNSLAFTANIPLVLTNGVSAVAGRFIRATTAGAVISLKRRA